MIADLTTDLLTKLKAIAGNPFGTTPRVGLAVGGKEADPMMTKVAKPAAWVMFTTDENIDPTTTTILCSPSVKYNFIVKIIMDYGTENAIVTTNYALLDTVRNAIHASTGPKGAQWKYEGQVLEELTNRMIYEQRYSVTTSAA